MNAGDHLHREPARRRRILSVLAALLFLTAFGCRTVAEAPAPPTWASIDWRASFARRTHGEEWEAWGRQHLRDGDLVFVMGESPLLMGLINFSKFSAEIAESEFSHVGIVAIEDGQPVRVSSRRGTVVLRAWVTQRTTVGVVFIPMHFHEAADNLLTIDALDPLAKIPEYKACAVRVVSAEKEELPPQISRGRY